MANIVNTNPRQVDTVGDLCGVTTEVMINGIIVIANADIWSAILKDGTGNVVFRADSSITNHRSIYFAPSVPFKTTGLRADTLTNIDLVLIYTVPS